jgi:PAS domain S-box-containing protein
LVRSAEGLPLHLLTVVEDLREQRDAERRLAEAQSWFAFAFQEGPLGIGFVSRDRRIRMANPALCRILGYSEQELSTIVASDLTAPEDMAADREFWRSFSEGPAEIRIVEKRVLHKDGHLVPVRLIVTPICDANGDLQYAMGLVEDLTRQKQAEEVVRRSDRLTAIGTLAAGIAHEINNPVAAALAAAETAVAVRGDPREAGTVDTCLQQIIGSLVRCGGIVRSILLFARDGVSEKRPGDLRKVTSRVLELTGDYAARLRVDINYTAPEFAIHASFNPLEIELMLTNLLRNAIEASPAGSSVALRLTQVSEGAEFLVQDSGSGMDDAQRTRFLDPFFSTRVNEGGTGLGASIAYGIIRAHEGRLEMESKPGIGTSIRVFLPA